MIFIEEAHNLIGPESEEQTGADADPKRAATAFVVKMLAEVRALKEGIVIADQLPTVMAQEVLKNTGLKIGLRITSADDRSLLGSTMAASALQLEEMATFAVGEALIFYEKLMRPFNMRIKEWWGEIKDEASKALMTTPRNDGDLRNALKHNPCYTDENLLSIKIMGKKYFRMFNELTPKIEATNYWYKTLGRQKAQIDQLSNYLEKVEMGIISISEEEKDGRYDQLEMLQSQYETIVSDRSKDREPIDLISSIMSWVYTLERLKKGRWRRFDAPEKELVKTTLLQSKLAETALELYRNATSVVGMTKTFKSMENDINELSQLEIELNATLSSYIEEHGAAALSE